MNELSKRSPFQKKKKKKKKKRFNVRFASLLSTFFVFFYHFFFFYFCVAYSSCFFSHGISVVSFCLKRFIFFSCTHIFPPLDFTQKFTMIVSYSFVWFVGILLLYLFVYFIFFVLSIWFWNTSLTNIHVPSIRIKCLIQIDS